MSGGKCLGQLYRSARSERSREVKDAESFVLVQQFRSTVLSNCSAGVLRRCCGRWCIAVGLRRAAFDGSAESSTAAKRVRVGSSSARRRRRTLKWPW